jgi:hypothetical protein
MEYSVDYPENSLPLTEPEYSFWDIIPFSPLKINRRFEGTYRLHSTGGRINRTR